MGGIVSSRCPEKFPTLGIAEETLVSFTCSIKCLLSIYYTLSTVVDCRATAIGGGEQTKISNLMEITYYWVNI